MRRWLSCPVRVGSRAYKLLCRQFALSRRRPVWQNTRDPAAETIMPTVLSRSSRFRTLSDLLTRLGDIPPARIRVVPALGTATPQDVVRVQESEGVLCELVDGVLVEKPMGSPESYLTLKLARLLGNYVEEHDLGYLLGPDGMTRLFPRLVRLPDISFTSWQRAPARRSERSHHDDHSQSCRRGVQPWKYGRGAEGQTP